MTSGGTYSDSLEAWQEALGEARIEAPHVHYWFHCTTLEGVKVWHCKGCEDRRITNGSPNDAPSAVKEGGSIQNTIFGKARDGMKLPYPMPSGEDGGPGQPRYLMSEPLYVAGGNPNLGYDKG